MPLQIFYSDVFELPLPAGHRFPIAKYRLLRERLQGETFSDQLEFNVAPAATDEQLRLVHKPSYRDQLQRGELSAVEERRIGFPWSPEMVERSRRSTGATIGAARAAIAEGAGVHLAGGTHHAFGDHGQGFCVFNDVAVATRVLQSEGLANRAVVIDLDVHQGNGTASIFSDDTSVFTFSMHGARNFPFQKCDGDLDVGLPDGAEDLAYLRELERVLAGELPLAEADIVFYLAGADPFEGDRFGKLALTKAGLAERDRLVMQACRRRDVPVAVAMAGGYAREIDDVVDINAATVAEILRQRA